MKENEVPLVSALILAGGQSRRFGEDKSLVLWNGRPLLAHVVYTLSALSDDLIVVTNDPARYAALSLPVRLVPDEQPGVGALMGLYSGLQAARYDYALAVACDMPLLSLPLLRFMLSLAAGHDVIVPRVAGWPEPLHAIYGKDCLPAMQRALESGYRQIIAFFGEVRVRYVEQAEIDRYDPSHLSFTNVNTVEDWARLQALMQRQGMSR